VSETDPLGGLPEPSRPQPALAHARPPATPTTVLLLALLGAGFLAEIWVGGGLGEDPLTLFRLGSLSGAAVAAGDFWRLGSYAFLHAGPVHLLVNGYALWVLMRPIEALFGPVVAMGIFAATAIAGGGASIASSALRHSPWLQAVGASGGIFGLFGAHCALYWRLRNKLTPEARRAAARTLLFNLLINLALAVGAQAAGFPLDNAAHAGGFLSGILLGLVAPSPALEPRPWGRPTLWLLMLASLALASMEGAAVARAVKPHPRVLRSPGVEARIPWMAVPFEEGRALTPTQIEVYLGREKGAVEAPSGAQGRRLGEHEWYESHGTDEKGGEHVVLVAPLRTEHLVVQAWCHSDECTPERRDELAEQVAAAARTTSR